MENNFGETPNSIFISDNEDIESPFAPQEPKIPSRKFNMGNDKDRNEYYQLLKIKALTENSKDIPKPKKAKEKESNVLWDDEGNVVGTKSSVVRGVHATTNNQADLLRALRKEVNELYGIKG